MQFPASKALLLLAACLVLGAASTTAQGVKSIGADSFEQALSSKEFVLVNFYAKWCPFSRKMQPIYEAVSAEFASSVAFTQVDVDEQKDLARQEKVQAVPTLKLFRHGALMAIYRGPQEAPALSAWIKNHAVSIPNLSGCSARAARKAHMPLIVGFYKHKQNPMLTNGDLDSHSALLGAVSRALAGKAIVVEHDEKERELAKEIGATGTNYPLFAVVDWVPSANSRSGFALRARFFDEKTPLNADSLIAWASKIVEAAQETSKPTEPESRLLQVLSSENFDEIVNKNDRDVLIAFVDKTRVEEGAKLMQAVATKLASVKTLDVALVNVDAVPESETLMKHHVGSKIVPSVWMFPAGNKNAVSIAIVGTSDLVGSTQMLVTFAQDSVTHSFELPKEGQNEAEKKPARTSRGCVRDVINVLIKWLGIFWLEL